MATYVDYFGNPTDDESVAENATKRHARDLERAQAAGETVGVDYFGQPTTDPRQIERAKERNARDADRQRQESNPKKLASGGKVGSASKRADGIAQRGKTRGKMI